MRPRFLLTGVIYRMDAEDEDEITKIKHVPADQIVATFEGNWRGEIKWKKVDDKVSSFLSSSSSSSLISISP
jgi:hypothetical protein